MYSYLISISVLLKTLVFFFIIGNIRRLISTSKAPAKQCAAVTRCLSVTRDAPQNTFVPETVKLAWTKNKMVKEHNLNNSLKTCLPRNRAFCGDRASNNATD